MLSMGKREYSAPTRTRSAAAAGEAPAPNQPEGQRDAGSDEVPSSRSRQLASHYGPRVRPTRAKRAGGHSIRRSCRRRLLDRRRFASSRTTCGSRASCRRRLSADERLGSATAVRMLVHRLRWTARLVVRHGTAFKDRLGHVRQPRLRLIQLLVLVRQFGAKVARQIRTERDARSELLFSDTAARRRPSTGRIDRYRTRGRRRVRFVKVQRFERSKRWRNI